MWCHINGENKFDRLSNVLYNLLLAMQDSKLLECKWINFVKNTLFNLGLGYVWDNPNVSPKWLIAIC